MTKDLVWYHNDGKVTFQNGFVSMQNVFKRRRFHYKYINIYKEIIKPLVH